MTLKIFRNISQKKALTGICSRRAALACCNVSKWVRHWIFSPGCWMYARQCPAPLGTLFPSIVQRLQPNFPLKLMAFRTIALAGISATSAGACTVIRTGCPRLQTVIPWIKSKPLHNKYTHVFIDSYRTWIVHQPSTLFSFKSRSVCINVLFAVGWRACLPCWFISFISACKCFMIASIGGFPSPSHKARLSILSFMYRRFGQISATIPKTGQTDRFPLSFNWRPSVFSMIVTNRLWFRQFIRARLSLCEALYAVPSVMSRMRFVSQKLLSSGIKRSSSKTITIRTPVQSFSISHAL